MYAKGRGVPVDYVLAYMWFNLAAAQGVSDAATNRKLMTKKMTKEQISEAEKLLKDWKTRT